MRGYSENEKDCPVCHAKNMQLVDALRAQSESRDQQELFHNLLYRSVEPFSVVAEYFGRGMFNEIVLVEEQDDTNGESSGNTDKTNHPSIAMKNPHNPEASFIVPVPEGRMRNQEASRYSSSLEANIGKANTSVGRRIESSPLVKPNSSVRNDNSVSVSKRTEPHSTHNPFDEDDDDPNKDYDESKNPFSDDIPEEANQDKAQKKSYPFDEYDNNLNPFS